ncbi:uncharacterized protein BKA55DRAFT_660893 [Fusarium redolens]|uniref:Ubiquitin-like domain-containing protein n=1 Tax=Fusarium redolens TaxID=48865 RepID=A0A9P9KNI7_FUSRE|nr:uncharacterized protein BKA55DRAFT_660893 [Fusarium redolens]KAH7265500.1 hypothetical protein BKA55DRAFT_660893 [Fusarium redolens]
MSFGYGVGDVIAVLGLCERIAIELRNYKDAPMQFQQLLVELDFLRGTLKRVLSLEPKCSAERETLEQIRAIVLYCAKPLQSMADRMRTKESSLGHFKSTRSLSSIGTRLHWSMVGLSDVQELRQTVVSQMAAINVLMSSLVIEKHANAMAGHASNILNIASKTQSAIGALAVSSSMQAELHSKQANEINKNLNSMEQSMRHMTLKTERGTAVVRREAAFITRHAKILFNLMQDIRKLFILRMLLDISGQLKRIIRAIEAIPLHLTLDIVRLDDVHGESWALPLQACRTWESFREMLQFVVYANKRPGAKYITHNLFAVTQAKTGKEVDQQTWETMVKPGFHLEQAIIIKGAHSSRRCLDPKCTGKLLDQALEFEDRQVWVKFLQATEPIQDAKEAYCRLSEDPKHAMANAFIGLEMLLALEEIFSEDKVQHATRHLEIAVKSDSLDALTKAVGLNAHIHEPWYNLGVLYDSCNGQHSDAADAFYKCLERKPELSNVRARLEAQQAYVEDCDNEILRDFLIYEMIDSPLQDQYGMVDEAHGEDVIFDPIRESREQDSEDETDGEEIEESD